MGYMQEVFSATGGQWKDIRRTLGSFAQWNVGNCLQ